MVETRLKSRPSRQFTILLGLTLIGAGSTVRAAQYSMTLVGYAPGYNYSDGVSINATGAVAVRESATSGGSSGAYVYSNGTLQNIGASAGNNALPKAINTSGDVLGSTSNGTFIYHNGATQTVSNPNGFVNAYAMNDSDKVTGSAASTNGTYGAFVYSSGVFTSLIPAVGANSTGYAINNSGDVAGITGYQYATNTQSVFLYSKGQAKILPTLGGTVAFAYGMNNNDDVVGMSYTASGDQHPYLYTASTGQIHDLGTLGSFFAQAEAVNDLDQVVGYGYTSTSTHAFLYSNGQIQDLNNLIVPGSGWTLFEAEGINDSGQISGIAENAQQQFMAFVLTPVPEPACAAVAVSGGVIALMRRRRETANLQSQI